MLEGATTASGAVLGLAKEALAALLRVLTALSLLVQVAAALELLLTTLTAFGGLTQDSAYKINQVSKTKQDYKYCCTVLVPEPPLRRRVE